MDITKISELVDRHYEIEAELREIEEVLKAIANHEFQSPRLIGLTPNGKRKEISILAQLAQIILQHQAAILRLQLEQIPESIRLQSMNTTPRLVARSSTTGAIAGINNSGLVSE